MSREVAERGSSKANNTEPKEVEVEQSERQVSERRGRRKNRIPLGGHRKKLDRRKDLIPPDMHDHFFADRGNRIADALDAGYEFIDDPNIKESVGEGPNGTADQLSNKVRVRTGTANDGSPEYSYLMLAPKAWHEEDRQAIIDRGREIEASIKRGEPRPHPNAERDSFYIPEEGVTIQEPRQNKR